MDFRAPYNRATKAVTLPNMVACINARQKKTTFFYDIVLFGVCTYNSSSTINQNILPPMIIITTENTFSIMVLAETFPKPTVVKEVQV